MINHLQGKEHSSDTSICTQISPSNVQSPLNQTPTLAPLRSAVRLLAESNGARVRGWFKWDWVMCR